MHLILLLAAFLLTGCEGMRITPRLTDADVAKIKVGMTTDQIKGLLGWPWKVVLHPVSPDRETYRYVLRRELHELGTTIVEDDDGVSENRVTRRQYREIELVFESGKLVLEQAKITRGDSPRARVHTAT